MLWFVRSVAQLVVAGDELTVCPRSNLCAPVLFERDPGSPREANSESRESPRATRGDGLLPRSSSRELATVTLHNLLILAAGHAKAALLDLLDRPVVPRSRPARPVNLLTSLSLRTRCASSFARLLLGRASQSHQSITDHSQLQRRPKSGKHKKERAADFTVSLAPSASIHPRLWQGWAGAGRSALPGEVERQRPRCWRPGEEEETSRMLSGSLLRRDCCVAWR